MPRTLYRLIDSRNITGLSVRIADLSMPFASSGVVGATTSRPGISPYRTSRLCECCAESWWPAPPGIRMTSSTCASPPTKRRRADAGDYDGLLRDRSIHHAVGPEAVEQPVGHAVGPAELPDVLAE